MNKFLLLAVPVAVLAVHAFALLASRRGSSRIFTLSFYSGLIGLLSIPALILAVIYSGPLPVVGPVNPSFATAANVIAVVAVALIVSSLALGVWAAAKQAHPAA